MDIDFLDFRIIRCLQENPRAKYAAIARDVQVSESTIKRRIESLIESGAIVTSVLVDLHALGFRTSAIIGLRTDLDKSRSIGAAVATLSETTYVAVTMGRFDVIFQVAARTLDELQGFLAEKIAPMAGVRDVEIMVMPRMIKGMRDWRLEVEE